MDMQVRVPPRLNEVYIDMPVRVPPKLFEILATIASQLDEDIHHYILRSFRGKLEVTLDIPMMPRIVIFDNKIDRDAFQQELDNLRSTLG